MLENAQRSELVEIANNTRKWSYSPYSKYRVGAALLSRSGKIYEGTNIENAAYPVSICAERVAVFKAVSQGEHEFDAIAVVTDNGGAPCGSCRQVMAEFGVDIIIIMANNEGEILHEYSLNDLLPAAFLPEHLT
jgi:cytidine deaminase